MPLNSALPTTTTRRGGYRPGAGRKKKPKEPIHRIRVSREIHERLVAIASQMNEQATQKYWMSDAFAQILSQLPPVDELIDRILAIAQMPEVKVLPPGKLIQVKEADLERVVLMTQAMQRRSEKCYAPRLSAAIAGIILYYQSPKKSPAD